MQMKNKDIWKGGDIYLRQLCVPIHICSDDCMVNDLELLTVELSIQLGNRTTHTIDMTISYDKVVAKITI